MRKKEPDAANGADFRGVTARHVRVRLGTPSLVSRLGAGRRICLACICLVIAVLARPAAQGVRVVDAVVVDLPGDESAHHFAGTETSSGDARGRKWRSATRWLSYSLRIYDDSPLTVVCVVADGGDADEAFDVLVDGRNAATFVRPAGKAKAAELKVGLALKETEGRTSVVVTLAAHPGGTTARLLELRTMQEHLE